MNMNTNLYNPNYVQCSELCSPKLCVLRSSVTYVCTSTTVLRTCITCVYCVRVIVRVCIACEYYVRVLRADVCTNVLMVLRS